MDVNFEPIIRGLKSKIRFIYEGFNCKTRQNGVKKWMKKSAIRGGGPPPNGKNHETFPFSFLEYFPNHFSIYRVSFLTGAPPKNLKFFFGK